MFVCLLSALALGQSFQIVPLQTPEGARQPQLAVWNPSRDVGHVWVAYGTATAVYVSASQDSGTTFGPPTQVGEVGALSLGLRRGPRIAIAGDEVVITAIAGEQGGGVDGDILSWRSAAAGGNWIRGGRVNEVVGAAREGLHAMAVGPKGEVYCVWIDLAKGEPRICGAASSKVEGGSWGPTHVVFADSDGICPCCSPSVTFDAEGRIHVMWRGQDAGSRDMVMASSDDMGLTFSKPTRIGTGTWPLEACPMDGGGIAVRGGKLLSVWRRESGIFRAKFTDSERQIGVGEQPSIAIGADGEYVTWLEHRGGPLLLLLPGRQDPVRLDEQANDPALASGVLRRRPVLAAWESGPSDAPHIVVARLDGGR